ncbi:hypothetical protein IQ257_24430 [Coleofasciculus sp. LEGE 07092]|nr:hypothetical protein [Coleofasciculus sp. LEGE 07081]MBE9151575.1 hypothetical protein [Coleofasciculus sp. LEGE 07092]
MVKEPIRKRQQPFFKAQTLRLLRGTIGLLEGVVEQLEAEPVNAPASIATPVLDTAAATPEPQKSLPKPRKTRVRDWFYPSFERVEALWDSILDKVRALLPNAWSEKLSDWGLTGAIAAILVVVLLTTVAVLQETPAQVAKEIFPEPVLVKTPPELKAPEPPQPVEPLETPELSQPVEVAEPPSLELTPEQSLIAAIQNQVAEITDQYANGLIQSIQANFRGSRLIVTVGEGWYDLDEPQQHQLADEILRRSEELDFSKLNITDPEGTLLARSPVVGSHMVILQRQQQELATTL